MYSYVTWSECNILGSVDRMLWVPMLVGTSCRKPDIWRPNLEANLPWLSWEFSLGQHGLNPGQPGFCGPTPKLCWRPANIPWMTFELLLGNYPTGRAIYFIDVRTTSIRMNITWTYMLVSENRGTPSHHPFIDGVSLTKTIQLLGYPMTMETSTCG